MRRGSLDKTRYMLIEPKVAKEIIRQDPSFLPFQRRNGGGVVILNKALYGCIESAKLWYHELAGTLKTSGFKPDPRDICIFTRYAQITIVVYVDDLMITSTDKSLVLEMERTLLKKDGEFRTSSEKTLSYLGLPRKRNRKSVADWYDPRPHRVTCKISQGPWNRFYRKTTFTGCAVPF
jgi:Reverse transcriptase (RNA-dependent DNA polymerase)